VVRVGCLGEFGVVFFEAVGNSKHELVVGVVGSGIIPHLLDVEMEFFCFFVDIVVEFELDSLDVDRIVDDAVVFGGAISGLVHWLEEGEDIFVGFEFVQDLYFGCE